MEFEIFGMSSKELAQRGEEIYHQLIRPKLTEADRGKCIVIDVDSGDYQIGKDTIETIPLLKARHPNAKPWCRRIGYTAYHYYGRPPEREPI